MNLGNVALGDRFRAYAKRAGKSAWDIAEEIKLPSETLPAKKYPGGKTVRAGARKSTKSIGDWLRGFSNPQSAANIAAVVHYLRRMKAE